MAPDTQEAMLKVNLRIVGALVGLIAVFITSIAWAVRLESRVDETSRAVIRDEARLEEISHLSSVDHDRSTKMETSLDYIVKGVEEIKSTLKDKH